MKNAVNLFGTFFFVTHKKVAVVSSTVSLNDSWTIEFTSWSRTETFWQQEIEAVLLYRALFC